MSTVVREIDGIKGFCEYHNNIPYTYIYTRDAIEMLGLVDIKNGKTYLRLNNFGSNYLEVLKEKLPEGISLNNCGINLTPDFKISLALYYNDNRFATGCEAFSIPSSWRPSKYDNILPEFILDRIVFAIANKLHNKIAEEFRLQLIWNIVPHFQQTATIDQINKVPILNKTTKFMYDNTNYSTVTQQQFNFAKQIFDAHINRFAILLSAPTMEDALLFAFKKFDEVLRDKGDISLNELSIRFMKSLALCVGINCDPRNYSIIDTEDAILGNRRIYMLFICFMTNIIRELENEQIRNANGLTEEINEVNGHPLRGIVYKDKDITLQDPPFKFIGIEDKADYENRETCRKYDFEDIINWPNINE